MSAASSPVVKPAATSPRNAARQARFDEVFAALIVREGERYTNDPQDRGGATKYGVCLRTLAQFCRLDKTALAEFDIDNDGEIDTPDIRGLTLAHAKDFYDRQFWRSTAIYALPAPFDDATFDQAVNDGAVAAVKLLQGAYNAVLGAPVWGSKLGLAAVGVDGRLGAETISAIDRAVTHGLSQPLLSALRAAASRRYVAIVAADPSQRQFLAGWIARAERLGDV